VPSVIVLAETKASPPLLLSAGSQQHHQWARTRIELTRVSQTPLDG
jgi:hypothetical protein